MRKLSFVTSVALMGAVPLALASCTNTKSPDLCPQVAIMPGLESTVEFRPGMPPSPDNVLYVARLVAAKTQCEVDKKTGAATATVTLNMATIRGGADIRKATVSYFAAVADEKQEILTKKNFLVSLDYPEKRPRIDITDELTERVPVPKGKKANNYTLLLGFQLTPEQREFIQAQQEGGNSTPTNPNALFRKPGS